MIDIRRDWGYTSHPFKVLGITSDKVVTLFLLVAYFVFLPSSQTTKIVLSVTYLFLVYYSKKHNIAMFSIPQRILNNIIGRERLPKIYEDKRKYDS